MPEENKLSVAPVQVANYLTTLTVVTEDGSKVSVPVDAQNNKLKSQITAAKLRDFMDKQIALYSKGGKPLPAAIIKDLISSASKVEELARFAYANLLTEDEGGERAGNTAVQMMKAAAEGMTAAHIKHNSDDRMKRITELGKAKVVKEKPVKEAEVIIEEEVA